MPMIQTRAQVEGDAERVWNVIKRGEVFPARTEQVVEVESLRSGEGERLSRWTVLMNGSAVGWTQREYAVPGPRLEFEQVEGDFDALSGSWSVTDQGAAGTGVTLSFSFDLGIDGLAPLLEPIWSQSLRVHADALLRSLADNLHRT